MVKVDPATITRNIPREVITKTRAARVNAVRLLPMSSRRDAIVHARTCMAAHTSQIVQTRLRSVLVQSPARRSLSSARRSTRSCRDHRRAQRLGASCSIVDGESPSISRRDSAGNVARIRKAERERRRRRWNQRGGRVPGFVAAQRRCDVIEAQPERTPAP